MKYIVKIFDVTGSLLHDHYAEGDDLPAMIKFTQGYGEAHSGLACIYDESGNVVKITDNKEGPRKDPGLLAEGEVSRVPYTLIMQRPSPDLPQEGETTYIKMSCSEFRTLKDQVELFAGTATGVFIGKCFIDYGLYRVELLIGDASLKIYKHPSVK